MKPQMTVKFDKVQKQIQEVANTVHEIKADIQTQSDVSILPFAPQVIILKNGQRMPFAEWQKLKGISAHQFSKFFSFRDKKLDRPDFQLSELLFPILDEFRKQVGKPVYINSAYRSQNEQDQLRRDGLRAVQHSPHTEGMAIDIDTTSQAQTYKYAQTLEAVAKKLGIKIRIGFRSYLKDGHTFIHLDVCPEYFAKDKPFHHFKHAQAWERKAHW